MRIFLLFVFLVSGFTALGQRTCATHDHYKAMLAKDPAIATFEEELEELARTFIAKRGAARTSENLEINIPVVFHVVYNKASENVPDQNLYEQLEVLNKDFNALNEDIINVPDGFKPYIGSLKLKFVLANRDPEGRVTTGITRTKTDRGQFSVDSNTIKDPTRGGVAVWNPDEYLNIWVGNIEKDILGYAAFPVFAGTVIDGVVISYRHIGVTNTERPYHLGRTSTHEVGHYLGLKHIWGDEESCSVDDGVSDTPQQFMSSAGAPKFPYYDICTRRGNGIMFMNYMDYSNDTVLNMFSKEQCAKMLATLSGPRQTLMFSKGYVPDTKKDVAVLDINLPVAQLCQGTFSPAVKVLSRGTDRVSGYIVSYQINDGDPVIKAVSEGLNLYQTAVVSFDPVYLDSGQHEIKFFISTDGDEVAENNVLSKIFKVGVANQQIPVLEGFEKATFLEGGYTIINPDGFNTWKRSAARQGKEGSYSLVMDNFNYDFLSFGVEFGQKDDFILPFLDLSSQENASLTFEVAAAQFTDPNTPENGWDTLQVLVSLDCGLSYDVVYNKFNKSLVTAPITEKAFVPKSGQWRKESINLSKYTGQKDVMVVFRNISYWENNVYIDDIQLTDKAVTGIRNQEFRNDIDLYPNPSNGLVTLKIGNQNNARLKQVIWTNAIGQTVQKQNISTNTNILQFNLSKQPKGLYIVQLLFEDGSVGSKKLILE